MGLIPLKQILRTGPRPAIPTSTLNVTYATIRSTAQKLDIYAPASPQKLTIVHVHGGGWTSDTSCNQYVGGTKDSAGNKGLVRRLVEYGGALVLDIDYPLVPVCTGNLDTDYRQQQIDAILAAIAWARVNSTTYNGSNSHIVIWGESAGGHLVLLAAAQAAIAGGSGSPDMVVAVSGFSRLDQFGNDSTIKNLLGINADPSTGAGQTTAQTYSSYNQWVATVPVYLLHDNTDPAVPVAQTNDINTKIGQTGGTVTKVLTSYGIHADFTSKPEWLAAYRACLSTLNYPQLEPFISNVASGSITSSGATITWTTAPSATTQAQYRVSGTSTWSYSSLGGALVTSHSQGISGLTTGTTYEYCAISDAGGWETISPIKTFTTL